MKSVLKTFFIYPSDRKLAEFRSKFFEANKGRDPLFDTIFEYISTFHDKYSSFLGYEDACSRLESANKAVEHRYLLSLAEPDVPAYQSDASFFSAVEAIENSNAAQDVFRAWGESSEALAKGANDPTANVVPATIDKLIHSLGQVKTKLNRSEASTSSLLWGGQQAGQGTTLREIYDDIKLRKETSDALYYDLGISHFDKAMLKPGDLIFFGAYTSHGKSIWLRYLAYRQVVVHGRNTAFFSQEMSHHAVRALFALLHANNKDIFPDTPFIDYVKWKHAELSEEEESFLFDVADYDLRNNKRYATLYIDQPNKSRFKLADLVAKVAEVEQTMPIHTLVVDYLTLLDPRESDKVSHVSNEDFNALIKSFKNYLLVHRDIHGKSAPLLGITAAQLSRKGLDEALKKEGIYDLSAFYMYTEIEKSADHVFTCLLTPDMKNLNRLRLQHLKNRDGEVVQEPCDIFVDFARGFTIREVQERSQGDKVKLLQSLDI